MSGECEITYDVGARVTVLGLTGPMPAIVIEATDAHGYRLVEFRPDGALQSYADACLLEPGWPDEFDPNKQ